MPPLQSSLVSIINELISNIFDRPGLSLKVPGPRVKLHSNLVWAPTSSELSQVLPGRIIWKKRRLCQRELRFFFLFLSPLPRKSHKVPVKRLKPPPPPPTPPTARPQQAYSITAVAVEETVQKSIESGCGDFGGTRGLRDSVGGGVNPARQLCHVKQRRRKYTQPAQSGGVCWGLATRRSPGFSEETDENNSTVLF